MRAMVAVTSRALRLPADRHDRVDEAGGLILDHNRVRAERPRTRA